MRVQDFENVVDVKNGMELETFLTNRFGIGVNEFWLSHNTKNPAMSILVKGDLASLHYFPKERHPGFRSVGKIEGLQSGEMTTFYINNIHEKQDVLNDSIIPFAAALVAAKEFLASKELPKSIEWFEL